MKKPSFYLAAALAALGLATVTNTGLAQNNWTGNGSNANWNTAENWSSGVPADGADVFFLNGNTSGNTINLNGNRTVGHLEYFNVPNAANFAIQGGISSVLTVNTGITRNGTNNRDLTLSSSNLVLASDADGFFINHFGSGGALNISAPIQGPSTALISVNDFLGGSARTVALGGNNSGFLGNWLLRRGTLQVGGPGSLGSGSNFTFVTTSGQGGSILALNGGTNVTWAYHFLNNSTVGGGTDTSSIQFAGGTNQNATLTLSGNFVSGVSQNSTSRLNLNAVTSTGATNSEGRILLTGNWSAYDKGFVYLNNAGSIVVANASALANSAVGYEINSTATTTVGANATGAGLGTSAKLILGGNFTMNNNLVFSGSGGNVNSYGAMNGGGTSAMNGTVSVNDPQGANLFSANSTGTMRFTNNISANNAANPLLVNGNFTYNPGTGAQNFTPTGIVEFARATGISYNGSVTVNAGTLLVNNTSGNGTGSGALTVRSGATLGGNGIITAATTINGTLSPGNSPGTLTISNALALDSTAVLEWEINISDTTVGGGVNDLVTGVTNLTLDGTINFSLVGGPQITSTGTWRILNYTGTLTNNTLSIGTLSLASGLNATIDTTVANQVNLVVIPEPSTWALIGIGAAAVVLLRRRRIS